MSVKFDPSGTGNFGIGTVSATITQQVAGVGGIGTGIFDGVKLGEANPFTMTVPDIKCQGPDNTCMIQVKQAFPGFTSCALVKVSDAIEASKGDNGVAFQAIAGPTSGAQFASLPNQGNANAIVGVQNQLTKASQNAATGNTLGALSNLAGLGGLGNIVPGNLVHSL